MNIELYQGDCLKVLPTLKEKSIDLVLTDPPYGMSFQSNHRKEKHRKIENDNNLDWVDFWLKELKRICKQDAHIYFFCSFHNLDVFMKKAKESIGIKNLLVWEKNNTSMGDLFGDYAPKYELIVFQNLGKNLNDGRHPNILNFNRTNNENHPTEKPTDLMQFLIKKSTNENDTVIDMFMGSGSTGVAAKKLGRNFIGIEMDKNYFEIAKDRIEKTNFGYQMDLLGGSY